MIRSGRLQPPRTSERFASTGANLWTGARGSFDSPHDKVVVCRTKPTSDLARVEKRSMVAKVERRRLDRM